jgi:hypothetical protein
MEMIAISFVPMLLFLLWLGAIIYAISLARRLVFATGRIAAALERSRPDAPGIVR